MVDVNPLDKALYNMVSDPKVKAKIEDIKNRPENHKHDFSALQSCCMIDGIFDTLVMQAHSDFVSMGTNGGVKCDVTSGPCACSAWH